jgi:hypothetical protein
MGERGSNHLLGVRMKTSKEVAAELSTMIGRLVLHPESGRVGELAEIYEQGCWCLDDREYFAAVTDQDGQMEIFFNHGIEIVNGKPKKLGDADGPDLNLRLLSEPIAVLATGDAFWIGEGKILPLPNEARELADNIARSMKNLLVGFAIAAKGANIDGAAALAIAKGCLRTQLMKLEAPGAIDG